MQLLLRNSPPLWFALHHEKGPNYILDVPRCKMDTDSRKAGIEATEGLEITPQMVEAGIDVCARFGFLDAETSKDLVGCVFVEMLHASVADDALIERGMEYLERSGFLAMDRLGPRDHELVRELILSCFGRFDQTS